MSRIKELRYFFARQTGTLLVLFLGYGGYYLCRANFAVARPLLLADFSILELDKTKIGAIAALGLVGYAVGKIFWATLTDFWGGKLVFLLGMAGSVLGTLYIGVAIDYQDFAIGWTLNRFAQAMGWLALVKIAAQWFPYKSYGKVMAFLSCSFLLGDSACRYLLGLLLENGFGWRGLFFAPAAGLVAAAIFCAIFLRPHPGDIPETPQINPLNLFGKTGEFYKPENLKRLLLPYFTSGSFWLAALLSAGFTIIRETFNDWSNTFLSESATISAGLAAQYSAIFSLVGCGSALAVGFLSDHATKGRRALFILLALPVLAVLFGLLSQSGKTLGYNLVVLSAASFFIVGPYTLLAGAVSLDLGGKKGASTASGLIDAAGYAGGAAAGPVVGGLAQTYGWSAVFLFLSGVAIISAIFAFIYGKMRERFTPAPIDFS